MSIINNNSQINPHMKFVSAPKGVVEPPVVYSYSLGEDLRRAEQDYAQLIKSIDKRNAKRFQEGHPNLKSNILGILKSMCKKPQKTPPSFVEEVTKIWHNITTKKVKK